MTAARSEQQLRTLSSSAAMVPRCWCGGRSVGRWRWCAACAADSRMRRCGTCARIATAAADLGHHVIGIIDLGSTSSTRDGAKTRRAYKHQVKAAQDSQCHSIQMTISGCRGAAADARRAAELMRASTCSSCRHGTVQLMCRCAYVRDLVVTVIIATKCQLRYEGLRACTTKQLFNRPRQQRKTLKRSGACTACLTTSAIGRDHSSFSK